MLNKIYKPIIWNVFQENGVFTSESVTRGISQETWDVVDRYVATDCHNSIATIQSDS